MRRLSSLPLLLLAACAGTPEVPPAGSTGRAFASRVPGVDGVPNLAKIAEGVFRGGQPGREGMLALERLGVKTVVNLRSYHSDRDEAADTSLRLVEMPLQADLFGSEPPTEEQLRAFFELLLDPAAQPVFFHCAHGKDRTGTMAALWRIEVDGWTADEAIEEMQAFGYHDFYKDLIDYVRAYRPRGFARPR